MFNKTPRFLQNIPWQNHLWRVPVSEKVLFLTFDDGPTPEITEQTLKILDDNNAKATFFCLGRNAEHHPHLVELILNKGHRLGNHSYSHLKGFSNTLNTYFDDVILSSRFLDTKLFRPPYGRIYPWQAKKVSKSFQIVMWEVLSHDYNRKISPEKCYKNVVPNVKPGSIIVFHDSVKAAPNMLKCLPNVLRDLTEMGYSFEVIPYNY
jgi:peptidoglycan/xylan/chitin deacetylase (PgdA/CDA1 family)